MQTDFAQQLRATGVYVTPQRLAVLRVVDSHPHIAAEDVLDAVRTEIGSISRQSVYDTVNTLSDLGLIRRIQPAGSSARYESRVGDNHHHLICRDCRAMVDVDCSVGYRPCLTASDAHGFVIDEAEVIYWGRCESCQKAHALALTQANAQESDQTQPNHTKEQS